ncbi:MAG: N-acetyltransferase [Succinivibrio sp.]|jgi:N-acetylglutamate synthase-like GNAT family acetyltransferase|uniref:N-acetyltransferase n=1 Tax=Succinivibrio sp. TaxID=2053619 RepID=UPI002A9E6124|nr:N-acetyltransferase [Succinivibrio sp.]MDY6245978.1 N-acetyltransferase [Succinivibrio sp.]MDY6262398.1 N-acetyltransferase [Succinivibrio sp.]HJI59671.1 N-acetyltransferase [Succinivibrionaceae bacterium]
MPPINQNSSSFVLLDEIKQNTLEELYDKVVDLYDKKLMSKEDLTKVNEALVTVNQVFLKQEKANFTVRQATLADVDSLMDMIEYWAKQGQNLPRKRNDIIRGIQTFAVCVKDDKVVGCACLYVYDSGLAEIRSLGVSPVIQRQGQGRAIVNYLLKRASKMFIQRVFVLTRSPEFFSKVGFQKTVIEALPEKILKDCENCPKREKCDEVAYIYNVKDHN